MGEYKKLHHRIKDDKIRICEIGDMELKFHHKDKQVEIRLVDHQCGHTLVHFVDYADWVKLARIE